MVNNRKDGRGSRRTGSRMASVPRRPNRANVLRRYRRFSRRHSVALLLAVALAASVSGRDSRGGEPQLTRVIPTYYSWNSDEQRSVNCLAFSPKGTILALGSRNEEVQFYGMAKPQQARWAIVGHATAVRCLAYSPDGRTLATGGGDGLVKLWDTEPPLEDTAVFRGHRGTIGALAFSPDGRTLASTADEDHLTRLWDVRRRVELATLEQEAHHVYALAFSPDGKTLAAGDTDGTVTLWDAATRKVRRTLRANAKTDTNPDAICNVAFSPNGKLLAAAGYYREVRMWDIETGVEKARYAHPLGASCVVFTRDGGSLITGGDDGVIRTWNVATAKEQATPKAHEGRVLSLALSPDGKTLASGGTDGRLLLWEMSPPAATDNKSKSPGKSP